MKNDSLRKYMGSKEFAINNLNWNIKIKYEITKCNVDLMKKNIWIHPSKKAEVMMENEMNSNERGDDYYYYMLVRHNQSIIS